ncbi:MAG: hypothetical protein JWM32_588 [Verrucomicrobia bacterium]|nr:hypothetical protein [Verrucomicrobiota bacterium]
MIAYVIAPLLILTLAGLAAIRFSLKHSVNGYEDELGFHQGVQPVRFEREDFEFAGRRGARSRRDEAFETSSRRLF